MVRSLSQDWPKVKIGDVCEVIPGYAFKSKDWQDNGIPVIKIKNIQGDGTVDTNEVDCVPENLLNAKLQKYVLKDRDFLVAMTGATAGKVGLLRTQQVMLLNQRVAKIKPVKGNKRFIWSIICSQEYQRRFFLLADGAAQPNMSSFQIEGVEIPFPDIKIQKIVAAILSAYDDLIENNLRRIKILEEMAQNLYREWFFKFRFPGHQKVKMVNSPLGKIPEGWETKTIGDVCTVIPGYAFKSSDWQKSGVPVIKIKNINSDNTINTDETDCVSEDLLKPTMEKFLLKDGDILIAMTGATAGKIGKLRSRQRMLLNQRVAKIEPHNPYNAFVWCTICTEECQARFFRLADGAAQPNMSGHQIEGFPILLPTKALCQDFSEMVNPFLLEIDNLIHRNRNLRQTRDLLLPKLISGELDVSELDISIPEAHA